MNFVISEHHCCCWVRHYNHWKSNANSTHANFGLHHSYEIRKWLHIPNECTMDHAIKWSNIHSPKCVRHTLFGPEQPKEREENESELSKFIAIERAVMNFEVKSVPFITLDFTRLTCSFTKQQRQAHTWSLSFSPSRICTRTHSITIHATVSVLLIFVSPGFFIFLFFIWMLF